MVGKAFVAKLGGGINPFETNFNKKTLQAKKA